MSESFSAFGFRVHKPWGPLKSGIPDSVEMPAPVNATTRRDCSTHSPAISSPLSIELHSTKNAIQRSLAQLDSLMGLESVITALAVTKKHLRCNVTPELCTRAAPRVYASLG